MNDAPAPGELRRVIGFWGGTALIIGLTIGSGIFRKPPTIAGLVPDPLTILGLWIFFGLVCLCGALALAELSSMLPRTGGVYVYLREAYGDAPAFVFGWLTLLVTAPAAVGALATVFGEFLLDLLGVAPRGFLIPGIAIAVIVLLTAANLLGTRLGSAIQGVFTVIKTAALAAIILAVFALGKGGFGNLASGTGEVRGEGIARAVASVIWTYDGWIAVSMIAGEVVAPERLMKRIIIVGMIVIAGLYIAANVAYFYMMPIETMAQVKAGIAREVMGKIAGPAGGTVIGLCILGSVFGALSANTLAKPRVAYAMARDGLSFGFLGKAHARWGTPHAAILVQGAVAVLLVLALSADPGQLFDKLTTYFVVVEWAALLFAVGAVCVLRIRKPDLPRPYRTPGYPVTPLFFMAGAALGLAAILWGEFKAGNWTPLIGLGIAAAGFPVYGLWRIGARSGRPGTTSFGCSPRDDGASNVPGDSPKHAFPSPSQFVAYGPKLTLYYASLERVEELETAAESYMGSGDTSALAAITRRTLESHLSFYHWEEGNTQSPEYNRTVTRRNERTVLLLECLGKADDRRGAVLDLTQNIRLDYCMKEKEKDSSRFLALGPVSRVLMDRVSWMGLRVRAENGVLRFGGESNWFVMRPSEMQDCLQVSRELGGTTGNEQGSSEWKDFTLYLEQAAKKSYGLLVQSEP